MLADQRAQLQPAGRLDGDLHLPSAWRSSLLDFILDLLPRWRDDPLRPTATAETVLTAQLCARLNSETRHSPGWDHLQFRMEEPDEQTPGRTIDLAAAPSGRLIWIDGRRYSQYQTLFPIECKRLPTPAGTERDEREYLHSRHGLRGGVQRFRASVHGGAHDHAALIGYLQTEDAVRWHARLQAWTLELAGEDWGLEEAPRLDRDDVDLGVARLSSFHPRGLDRPPIRLSHLWIQMTDGRRAATLQGVRLAPS